MKDYNFLLIKSRVQGYNLSFRTFENELINNINIETIPKNYLNCLLRYEKFRNRFNDFIYNRVIEEINNYGNSN